MGYSLSRRARFDVLGIWQYIAKDSEAAADRFIDALTHRFQLLRNSPYVGRQRNDLRYSYRICDRRVSYYVPSPES